MERNDFGIEQLAEKHRAYRGSRFAEAREAIFANPHQKIRGEAEESPLPRSEADLSSVSRGALSRALVIGRCSTCCSATRRGEICSFSRVGKLYPTADPHHPEPLQTASFFTQEAIGGDDTRCVNDAVTCNAPNVTPWRRRKGGLPVIMIEGIVFTLVDRKDSQPQLYQIAELGKPRGRRH